MIRGLPSFRVLIGRRYKSPKVNLPFFKILSDRLGIHFEVDTGSLALRSAVGAESPRSGRLHRKPSLPHIRSCREPFMHLHPILTAAE